MPSEYPDAAWYAYTDKTCIYPCQAIEYIWWGYCSFSGTCNGRSGDPNYEAEWRFQKKEQFVAGDLKLSKLFTDSDTSDIYKLPTHNVDGTYTGCNTCSDGGPNHA